MLTSITTKLLSTCALLCLATTLPACGSDDAGALVDSVGIGQGGAQDFGQFREILESGAIPGPETLDDVGFFNEHKLELPPATCGQDICLHGQLGVMGNMITGSNCTLVLLGMNSAVDPSQSERLPLNLAIAIDTSGSMQGASIEAVREGLRRMLDELRPEDRITLVAFANEATVLLDAVPGGSLQISDAISKLEASGSTNIYEGLRTAYEAVDLNADPAVQNRVILLSDGRATAGIQSDARLLEMSRAYSQLGFGLTTIGMGTDFDPSLMRELSETGAGAFYFLEDPFAVQEVFEQEVKAFLIPIARDLEINLQVDGDYTLRTIYGTKLATMAGNRGSLSIPTVQLAGRTSADDNTSGRRGGGGATLAELVPRSESAGSTRGAVGTLTMSYQVPGSDEVFTQETLIQSELAVGDTPSQGVFDGSAVEKGFVMLNIYAGFDLAAGRAVYGDYGSALAVLDPLAEQVTQWLATNEDADIRDDLRYLNLFIDNLVAEGAQEPPQDAPRPDPWPRD